MVKLHCLGTKVCVEGETCVGTIWERKRSKMKGQNIQLKACGGMRQPVAGIKS